MEGIAVGDRVTASPLVPCNECPRCLEGRFNLCAVAWTQGIAYGRPGAFAQRVRIPGAIAGQNVFPLGDDVSDDAGALTEPLAVAVHAVKLAGSVEGATAVVLGLGTIGQQVLQALKAGRRRSCDRRRPVRAAARGRRDARRRGRRRLGRASRRRCASVIGEGQEIDVVFECSGVPALANAALEHVRGGGTIVVLALYDDPVTFNPTVLVQKEIRLQGSIAYTGEDFADAVELLSSGRAQSTPLITQRSSLDDVAQAFEVQLQKDRSLKVIVTPNGA